MDPPGSVCVCVWMRETDRKKKAEKGSFACVVRAGAHSQMVQVRFNCQKKHIWQDLIAMLFDSCCCWVPQPHIEQAASALNVVGICNALSILSVQLGQCVENVLRRSQHSWLCLWGCPSLNMDSVDTFRKQLNTRLFRFAFSYVNLF